MRLFAVFHQCLSVMHIVLARSSGVKSKVLATSCNTHNIGLQYMIGCLMNFQCFAIFSHYKSTFPMLILLSKLIPRIVETLEVWPSTAAISSSQGLGGLKPPFLPNPNRPGRPGDQWSCCHDRRSDPFRSSTSDAWVLWMFLGTLFLWDGKYFWCVIWKWLKMYNWKKGWRKLMNLSYYGIILLSCACLLLVDDQCDSQN